MFEESLNLSDIIFVPHLRFVILPSVGVEIPRDETLEEIDSPHEVLETVLLGSLALAEVVLDVQR